MSKYKYEPIITFWNNFFKCLTDKQRRGINPPAMQHEIESAAKRLQCDFPSEICTLYSLFNGFQDNSFILRDDYRILTLEEMVNRSGKKTIVVTNAVGGEFEQSENVERLIFAETQADNPDIEQVSLHLDSDISTIEIWFREGGIHDFEEVVDTELSMEEWLEECLEYY